MKDWNFCTERQEGSRMTRLVFSNSSLQELKREFIWLVENKFHRAKFRLNPNTHHHRVRNNIIDTPENIKEDIKFLKAQIKVKKSLLKRDGKYYRKKYKKKV